MGMDWLSNQADICCTEKIIRIPLPEGETPMVHGEKFGKIFKVVTCTKMRKYLRKDYIAFLEHLVDKEIEEKCI